MIRNVVFDLGGVLFNFQPMKVAKSVFPNSQDAKQVVKEIFEHPDWRLYDTDQLSYKEAVPRFAERVGCTKKEIRALLKAHIETLTPIPSAISFADSLYNKGHFLFVLSNINQRSLSYLKKHYGIWDMFSGIVASGEIGTSKPDPEIFHHLISTYGTEPIETVFIDDNPDNTNTAFKLGFRAITFTSLAQCKREMNRYCGS